MTTEDWWSVWLGLIMVALGLFSLTGINLVGWVAKPKTWADPTQGPDHRQLFKPLAGFLKEAAKPEWFIKTAIVYLGIKLDIQSMSAADYAFELAITGAAATFAADLLFWPIRYTVSRRIFKLPREWAATLASGVSICGVSASIATGGAIRSKPIVPVIVSALVDVHADLCRHRHHHGFFKAQGDRPAGALLRPGPVYHHSAHCPAHRLYFSPRHDVP